MRDYSNEPDLRILSILHRLERPALAVVVLIVGSVLVLWLVPALAPAGLDLWSRMVPSSAVTLLAAVTSLVLSEPRRTLRCLQASRLIGYAILIFAIAVLALYAAGYEPPANTWRRLPAPQTALAFTFIGIACANIQQRHGLRSQLVDLCVVALIGVVLFLLAGYVFLVEQFVGVGKGNVTAQHTLACLALLTLAIIARRAREGRMFAMIVGRGIGSHITRLVLPAAVLMPFLVFGIIGYLDRNGILSATYARAIAAPLEALAIIAIVAWMGKYTNGLERELRRQTLTDELTGIYNRRGFFAVAEFALTNAARAKMDLILFYFDLDGLKQANDRYGHDVGSLLIRRFAQLLFESFRKNDIVARVGGDEFVVLASGDAAHAADLLERLQCRIAEDNGTNELPVDIAYSTGCLAVPRTTDASIDELIMQADAMMYEQKRLKRQAA